MTKYRLCLLIGFCALTVGCSTMKPTLNTIPPKEPTSLTETMTTCLKQEALTQIQNGEAFATSVRSTAKGIVTTCFKKVVPETEKTGLSQETFLPDAIQILNDLLSTY